MFSALFVTGPFLCETGLCTKSRLTLWSAALPPDVRRGSATPLAYKNNFGAAPPVRPLALKQRGRARTGGRAQLNNLDLNGVAKPRLTSGGKAAVVDPK